jgi:hypothetical protein
MSATPPKAEVWGVRLRTSCGDLVFLVGAAHDNLEQAGSGRCSAFVSPHGARDFDQCVDGNVYRSISTRYTALN